VQLLQAQCGVFRSFLSPLSPPTTRLAPPIGAWPSKSELLACLPPELTRVDPVRSWGSLAFSLGLSLVAYGVGSQMPLTLAAIPLWLLYAVVTGTVAMGCWVLAHECGHGAFHPNPQIETAVGFTLHSLLLVPYFSWQHSHAVHHGHCNQLERGETHVPPRADSPACRQVAAQHARLGPVGYGLWALVTHLLVGWPLYLFLGVAGGEHYGGATCHFWPSRHGSGLRPLFPARLHPAMLRSSLGVVVVLLALGATAAATSPARVLAVYGLPYLVVNAWLVAYTWLQHTDLDIPHYDASDWSWAKGALQTVDRPYGPLLNLLHHGIGSTHVCHHINPRIPHYHAWRGNELLRQRFPEVVLYDPTPIHRALWRVASRCTVVDQAVAGGGYFYGP
jgi:omega-6 fatty acid desaturase (delta-12 desaturase)